MIDWPLRPGESDPFESCLTWPEKFRNWSLVVQDNLDNVPLASITGALEGYGPLQGMPLVLTKNYQRSLSRFNSLAEAVYDLPNNGADGGEILIDGDLELNAVTAVPGKISLIGRGSNASRVIAPADAAFSTKVGLIELIDTANVALHGFTLDGNGPSRDVLAPLGKFILINNAHDILLDDLVFTNGGYDDDSQPTGPYVELLALDDLSDATFANYNTNQQVGSVEEVLIRSCRFERQEGAGYEFAIRLVTDWSEERDPDDFVHHVENCRITECTFLPDSSGVGFGWNTVEFGGGGTRYNEVDHCTFAGYSLQHLDLDKGANHNTFAFNRILSGGRPDYHLAFSNRRASGIGVHGVDDNYITSHNRVIYNDIFNIENPSETDVLVSAILVEYASDNLIDHNRIYNVQGGTLGRAIHLGYTTPGNIVTHNEWDGVKIGLATNGQNTNRAGIRINYNKGHSDDEGIYLYQAAGAAAGGAGDFELVGNDITIDDTLIYALYASGVYEQGLIAHNRVKGGATAIAVDTPNTRVIGNTATGATYGYRIVRDDAVLTGNSGEGGTAAMLGQSGATPQQHGNSWNFIARGYNGDATLTGNDLLVLVNCTSASRTITLPSAAKCRNQLVIQKSDAGSNSLTIVPPGSEVINGASSVASTDPHAAFTVMSDGVNWFARGSV